VVIKLPQKREDPYLKKLKLERLQQSNCTQFTNQRRREMLNKKKRDSMVVMLEGYPEEDLDATLPKEMADEAESVDEAMEMAEAVEEDGSQLKLLRQDYKPW